jgi:hypothetical protein
VDKLLVVKKTGCYNPQRTYTKTKTTRRKNEMNINFKDALKRGSALLGVGVLLSGVGASALLPGFASADSLNPLTDRSLTLSSSSPGWAYTDGSGNSTYAPPNSGANGQKTGNYFDFKVSTDSSPTGTNNPITAMSFQYCTKSAGNCDGPGDNTGDPTATINDTSSTSDLNVNYPSPAEISGTTNAGTGTITLNSGSPSVTGTGTSFTSAFVVGGTFVTAGGNAYVIKSIANDTSLTITTNAVATETGVAFSTSDFNTVVDTSTGLVKAVPGYTDENPKYQSSGGKGDPAEAAKNVAGNFLVMTYNGTKWVQSTGWTATTSNQEDTATTGKQNTIILQNSTGMGLTSGTEVKVLFFATSTNYITNPGASYFFVKINTFKTFPALSSSAPINTLADNVAAPGDVIDGGVTVANVMNQSIQITTKVLETMQFSVGTVDPDTLTDAQLTAADGAGAHTPCDTVLTGMTPSDAQDVLQLGDQTEESSLSTLNAYTTHSYWRLSSNSSAGATVYYSGHTLSNTSGDEIAPIGTTAKASAVGSEQFGLALDTTALTGGHGFDDATYGVNYTEDTAGADENAADNGVSSISSGTVDPSVLTDNGAVDTPPWDYSALKKSYHDPRLDPLVPTADYGGGAGSITTSGSALFAFDPMSDTIPAPIATESSQVVDCVTGKMRYIANIAATTPAGIYTTKVNYIAAPQY